MPSCTSCGSYIPEGQGKSCSMCYGDIDHGTDGYYRAELERAEYERQERDAFEREQEDQHEREHTES